jgi:hypothetical protein
MQDDPELNDLISCARRFLEEEIVPAVADPRLRFRARVAANLLAIVSREIREGEGLLAGERRRLQSLLGSTEGSVAALNSELERRIRAGEIEAGPGGPVWGHLRLTALEKLRIANPAYLRRVGEG